MNSLLALIAQRQSLVRPEIDGRLQKNPKITILPHVGTHTYESRYQMEMLVLEVRSRIFIIIRARGRLDSQELTSVQNVRAVINGGDLLTQVPEQRAKK